MNKERGWAARRSTLSSASWKVNFFVILVPLWNGLSTNGDVRSSDNIIESILKTDIQKIVQYPRVRFTYHAVLVTHTKHNRVRFTYHVHGNYRMLCTEILEQRTLPNKDSEFFAMAVPKIFFHLCRSNKHLEWVVIQQISNEQVRVVVNSTTEE
ncbi:8697_t:CDS:2 [Rhizophagus irregularis]|nr:8697_t:CDS:2 [Rhizophagus irregularis]